MQFKRDNELINSVNGVISSINDEHDKQIIQNLLNKYMSITYKEYSDRHAFYQEVISDIINDCGFDDDAMADKLSNEHPTLQQNFMRLCRKFIKKMAEKKYYDGRNESSVKLAKKISEVIDDEALPFV